MFLNIFFALFHIMCSQSAVKTEEKKVVLANPVAKKTVSEKITSSSSGVKSGEVLPSVEITDVVLKGEFIDKKKTLKGIIKILAKTTTSQLRKVLEKQLGQIGYGVVEYSLNGTTLFLKLKPVVVVRNVFIKGNWPLFETDIMRRVILRPGTPLPFSEVERKKLFDLQHRRIEDYLHREGYFDSIIKIKIRVSKKSHTLDLYIHLNKGSSYKLGKLGIKGNTAMKSADIAKFFQHKLFFYKRPFYKQQFKKDIKKLEKHYRKLGYFSVSVRDDFDKEYSLDRSNRLVNVNIFVRERKKVEIKFSGNRKIGREELLGELSFVSSGTYDDHEIGRSADAIVHAYQKKGYFNTVVHHKSYVIGAKSLKIIYYIMEGKQYRVGKISFSGNKYFSDRKLKKEIETKVFPRKLAFFGLGSGGFITPVQLKQDADRIKKYYNNAGFPDTKVFVDVRPSRSDTYPGVFEAIESTVPSTKGHEYVNVYFKIEQGKRVLIKSITFKGTIPEHEKAFRKMSKVAVGNSFSMEKITEDLKKFKVYLANKGFPHTVITTDIKASEKKDGVVLVYNIEKGKKVFFGPIILRGNFKTRSSVVWKEIPFRNGDAYSISAIEEAGRNIRSLGVFRSVRVQFLSFSNKTDHIPVVISVIERYDDAGELEVGGGLSTDNLYFASFAYRNKNLFGYAKSMELKGEIGAEIQSGRITFQDQRFLNSKLIFEVAGYGRQEKTVRLGDILTFGASITLRKRWSQRFQWFLRYEIRHVSYKETLIRVSGAPEEDSTVDFATTTASIGPTVIWDKRDNPLVPRKGYRLTSSVRIASNYLGGDDNFLHFNNTGQVFIGLPLGLVLAQGIRYDHGIPLWGTNVLPKVERFFAGGDTTVRGYEEDRLFAQVISTPMNPGGGVNLYKSFPLGGNIRFLSNTELQFPIFKKSFLLGMPIWGAFFFDSGYIVNNYESFTKTLFHNGYGAALRLVSPVGVISLEYGIPLNKVAGTDPSGRVHFNFGFIF
ncbi:MAG: outer membrane protein assembly factor BamA [Deltaproteobacteria bacterium]|nr:outer membrane protein assembly factor BamA [Deltaproteobacteria bacterium]